MREEFFVGLDLGKVRDYAALAVVERVEEAMGRDPVTWAARVEVHQRVRHVERIPLKTPYPEVVLRAAEVTNGLMGVRGAQARCELMVDATGGGMPVVDLLAREQLRCGLRPVEATSGGSESEADGMYRVPKRNLMTGLVVMLQSGELQIAKGMEWGPALLREMQEMRLKVSGTGTEVFGGPHDDMVFAMALAAWGSRKFAGGDLYGGRRIV